MRFGAVILMILTADAGWAGPVVISPQLITLPGNASEPMFVDLNGNGRCSMLVIDPVEKKLFNYRQYPNGFSNAPDQAIALPPQTAWAAPCDVEAHPGLELLFSTATGLVYSRQDAGLFESERHTLIEANQLFTNFDFPILTRLSTNKIGTKELIPVISAGQAVPYRRNSAYEWSPEPPLALSTKETMWRVRRDQWTLGANSGHSVRVQQSFLATPGAKRDETPENETIRKLIDEMKKDPARGYSGTNRMDVDGDGREDLVLWRVSGKLDVKTDVYVFLRGADQKLPEHPTQTLHCSGFPIPAGATEKTSPLVDLAGDGGCELVLLELKSNFATPSGILESWQLASTGLEWSLTIRTFNHGGFARIPDTSVSVTAILPSEVLDAWPLFIYGDFNGDGRPDLVVRRGETQWYVYYSTNDGHWFAPQPALAFDAPDPGYAEITDLNGDGLSDIIWHEMGKPNLSIFMSPSRPAKGKNP